MTPTRKPLAPRVDELEHAVAELEKTTAQLRRDQSTTRRLVRELGKRVDAILPSVKTELDEQTAAINEHVDEKLEEHSRFVVENIVDVARQWPALPIVLVTFVLALVAIVLGNWALAALHLPHIGG